MYRAIACLGDRDSYRVEEKSRKNLAGGVVLGLQAAHSHVAANDWLLYEYRIRPTTK